MRFPLRLSFVACSLAALLSSAPAQVPSAAPVLHINGEGYFEEPGFDVMMFDDFYPEGHQGGLTIIQAGTRVAANGDLRFDPTPGQWSAVPAMIGERKIDRERGAITVNLMFPDTSRRDKGFNPIAYPGIELHYSITARGVGESVVLTVDLRDPLPAEWGGRVGFNLELFPGALFGEHYLMDDRPGLFPRQANGPLQVDRHGELQSAPMAIGKELVVAPDNDMKRLVIAGNGTELQLIDGRGLYNNGWFVVRSTIQAGATGKAVEWTITPSAIPNWEDQPVIQVSQVGYHPRQKKYAVIELDKRTSVFKPIRLVRIEKRSETTVCADSAPSSWGDFLRYKYLRFDFSPVDQEGLYKIRYGTEESQAFEIRKDIYARDVWQPTLEYFLPVQMCHMRVNDRYRVWHGLCHMDDARMAPVNRNHFDGYSQGDSTLTRYSPGDHVPGLNVGGWHDAGDYDLRVESQTGTVYRLALAEEFFRNDYDRTSVDEREHVTSIHEPDGKPDILQQIEHGVLSIVGGFDDLGRRIRTLLSSRASAGPHSVVWDGKDSRGGDVGSGAYFCRLTAGANRVQSRKMILLK